MTRASRRGTRGTAVPETALVVSIFLMTLYGIVQYAVLGYEQVSADGATFVGAHDTVAQYAGPSSTNNSYTQKVIGQIYNGVRNATVSSVANNGSYETDITVSSKNATGFASLLPTSMTTTSREIEASSSTASGAASSTNTPVGTCATGAITLLNGAVAQGSTPAVNLLQGTVGSANGLFDLGTDANGNTVVDLATGAVSARLTALQAVQGDLATTSTLLQGLSTLVNPPVLGGALDVATAPAATILTNAIQPVLTQALNGKLTQSTLNATTAALQSNNNLLIAALGTGLTPLLYGTGQTPGLLSGGTNGGALMLLSNAEAGLTTIDAAAPVHC